MRTSVRTGVPGAGGGTWGPVGRKKACRRWRRDLVPELSVEAGSPSVHPSLCQAPCFPPRTQFYHEFGHPSLRRPRCSEGSLWGDVPAVPFLSSQILPGPRSMTPHPCLSLGRGQGSCFVGVLRVRLPESFENLKPSLIRAPFHSLFLTS